jgi:hypothetical protein
VEIPAFVEHLGCYSRPFLPRKPYVPRYCDSSRLQIRNTVSGHGGAPVTRLWHPAPVDGAWGHAPPCGPRHKIIFKGPLSGRQNALREGKQRKTKRWVACVIRGRVACVIRGNGEDAKAAYQRLPLVLSSVVPRFPPVPGSRSSPARGTGIGGGWLGHSDPGIDLTT